MSGPKSYPAVAALVILLLFSNAMLWGQLRFIRDRVEAIEGVAPVSSGE